jgi:DUF1680 family protein
MIPLHKFSLFKVWFSLKCGSVKSMAQLKLNKMRIPVSVVSYLLLSCFSSTTMVLSGEIRESTYGDYPFKPVSFTRVTLTDDFWSPRLDVNRRVTIPYDFKKSEETHRIDNFAVAGGLKEGTFVGIRYNDSDVFKIIEGAAYSLNNHPDAKLEEYLDNLIAKIAEAQENDGYLYTCRTINPNSLPRGAGEERWSNLKDSHELYNVGHMYEAAVAYYQGTGKGKLLDVALKNADLIVKTFGPGKDQLHGVPGHQEIEIGLVKLYRMTGDEKYLTLAKYFLDQRGNQQGHQLYVYGRDGSNKTYTQDHKPVVEQTEAIGHAVRAAYMYSAMSDIAALTGDKDYLKAIHNLWHNVTDKKLYITGGIGAKHSGEAFGKNYQLPNLSCYCETCAAIANMLWNHRLFLLHGHAKYIDVLERTLYNNFLSGVSIDGDEFFYPNPLESDGSHKRSPWFDCSCCPTNVARFMPSLPGYIYARRGKDLYVNLFVGSEAHIDIEPREITINQETDYPWRGKVLISLQPEHNIELTVKVRIPGWARNKPVPGDLYHFINNNPEKPVIKLNGKKQPLNISDGYHAITRVWRRGDEIELVLPMPVRKVIAHDSVEADRGKYCLQRGPVVYAAEWCDNGGRVRNLMLEKDARFSIEHRENMIDGITVLTGKATALSKTNLSKTKDPEKIQKRETSFTAIPYYAWAHRGPGEMMVWLPYREEFANPVPPPTIASESKVTASYIHDAISAVNDQIIPNSSSDQRGPRLTFWNHKGTEEWVQYDFEKPKYISATWVYWFDDSPQGGCRIPHSWKLLYRDTNTGQWSQVIKHGIYPVEKDTFNKIAFASVKTDALRMVIQLRENYSGGILEWKVE